MLDRLRSSATTRTAPMPGSTGVAHEFAIIDLETTGLDPRVDRVIEVAVVITDAQGNVRDEFCTLVGPEGGFRNSAQATRVHLIDGEWLKAAPPTSAVLAEVAHRLNGRVVVAHNAMFDTEFLQQEFKRCLGFTEADLGHWTSLCTMDLCRSVDMPQKLDRACFELGIRYEKHSALGDCYATSQLLHRFMAHINPATFAHQSVTAFGRLPEWQAVERSDRVRAEEATTARPVLDALIASLQPHDGTSDRDPAATASYLAALEDAISDGFISADEVAALSSLAQRYGLTSDELRDLHQEVVLGLIDNALDDRRISKAERSEIERVATWLGVDLSDWDAMVKAARARIRAAVDEFRTEVAGTTVAFSGAGIHKANIREALALKHGLTYSGQVGPTCDLLVIGTAETQTAQLPKARQQNVPVMVEAAFWRRLGEV